MMSRIFGFGLLMLGMNSLAWADCASPAGKEGEQVYASSQKTMVFCNGTDWMAMGSASLAGGAAAVSGTGAVQFNSGNSFAADGSNLYWDIANKRLGVGTTTPTAPLTVNGTLDIGWEKVNGSTGTTSTASCTSGKKVIGGGCYGTCYGPDENGNKSDAPPTSYPSSNTAWSCACTGGGMYGGAATGYNLTAYAICGRFY